MKLTVGVIGKASGVRGEVRIALHTDNPRKRFAPGAQLLTDSADTPTLTVRSARFSGKHFVASFEQSPDRSAAEELAGTKLFIDTGAEEIEREEDSEDGFYLHELRGLRAETRNGTLLGKVSDLIFGPAQDLLEVTTPSGETVLVPFVYEIVPEVDLETQRVVLDPPGGLFEP